MAKIDFGGVVEEVATREEFSLEKAREILKNETIAVLGYGVQGPGQACNLRDNGFNVIVGQRQGKTFEKAKADGWVPGETLFSIEEAAQNLLKFKNKVDTEKIKEPSFLVVLSGSNYSYQREDGVYVVSIGSLKD